MRQKQHKRIPIKVKLVLFKPEWIQKPNNIVKTISKSRHRCHVPSLQQ
jgi:hypothetical protein